MSSAIISQTATETPPPTSLSTPHAASKLSLEEALREAEAAYVSRHKASQSFYDNAVNFMPGGNTRSVLFNEPFPIFMKRGSGNKLWDHDGNTYIDFVGELTAGLYGHSHPILKETLTSTYENIGVNLGATTVEEMKFAELISKRFSSIEQLRFCNSGTEANLYALSIARHVTGRRKIISFDGGYHGGVISFGHGIAPNNVDQTDWVLGEYNDPTQAKDLIENTPDVAAVIVEAMQGAGGCIPATVEFLEAIQTAAAKREIIFILDEVMTSRLHPGGLQGRYSLKPDLTTLGKYLGGGLAFGAFGGRRSLLTSYDPRTASSLPHSGTFNNNTLAMNCGYVGLSKIYTPEVALELNALGDYFRQRLQVISADSCMVITGVGAVLTIHFLTTGEDPSCAGEIAKHSIPGLKKLFWYWCLSYGFWITERGMLSVILGTTKEELNSYIDTVSEFLQQYSHIVKL